VDVTQTFGQTVQITNQQFKLRLRSEEREYLYNELTVIVMKLKGYKEGFNCLSEIRSQNKLRYLTISSTLGNSRNNTSTNTQHKARSQGKEVSKNHE
jgi:hypothetical protein